VYDPRRTIRESCRNSQESNSRKVSAVRRVPSRERATIDLDGRSLSIPRRGGTRSAKDPTRARARSSRSSPRVESGKKLTDISRFGDSRGSFSFPSKSCRLHSPTNYAAIQQCPLSEGGSRGNRDGGPANLTRITGRKSARMKTGPGAGGTLVYSAINRVERKRGGRERRCCLH
jgi:hypothetical protein